MAIGDVEMDPDGLYGLREIACTECVGLTGQADPDCIACDGEGIIFEMIAPEGEVDAAFANVVSQINQWQRPH